MVSVSGSRSFAGRGNLPELDEHSARLLEHQAHATRKIGRGQRGPRPGANVQQVLAPRVSQDLTKPPQRREHRAHCAHRMAKRRSATTARHPAPSGHVQHDRHRQRCQHAEKHDQGNQQQRMCVLGPQRDNAGDQPDEPAQDRRHPLRQRPIRTPSTLPMTTPIAVTHNGRINK